MFYYIVKGPGDIEYIESIDISNIPEFRKQATCYLCGKKGGACMSCSVDGCRNMFHVTCAREHNIKMVCTVLDTDHDPKTFMLDEAQERVKHILVSPAPYSEGIYKAWCGFHKCPPLKKRRIIDPQQQQQSGQSGQSDKPVQRSHQSSQYQLQQQIKPSRKGLENVMEYMVKNGLVSQTQYDQVMARIEVTWLDTNDHRYFCECGMGFDTPHSKANHSNSCQIHKIVKSGLQRGDKQLLKLLNSITIQSIPFTHPNDSTNTQQKPQNTQNIQQNVQNIQQNTQNVKNDLQNISSVPQNVQQNIQQNTYPTRQKTIKKPLEDTETKPQPKPSRQQQQQQQQQQQKQEQQNGLWSKNSNEDESDKSDEQENPPAYGNLSYSAVLEKLSMYLSRHVEAVYRYWIKRRRDNNDYPLLKMFELAFVGVSHQEVTPTIKVSNNKQSYQKLCVLNDDLNGLDGILRTINVNTNTRFDIFYNTHLF